MNPVPEGKRNVCAEEPESSFWESELYSKSSFRSKRTKMFSYYDNSHVLKYLFFHWLNKWVKQIGSEYVEPYKLHPLPVSDQVLRWQPIFSKHLSDGLFKLESNKILKSNSKNTDRGSHTKSILLRSLLLTIWKRALFVIIGLVFINVLSMSISILVKRLLEFLNEESIGTIKIFLLLLVIIVAQLFDELLLEIVNFYISRLICIIHYLTSIGVFQHGLCHRRKYSNDINGSNSLNCYNQVIHTCSPDSECSKNPLFCPALRYQNKNVDPQIYSLAIVHSFFIAQAFESFKYIMEFITNFSYGIFLVSFQLN